MKNIHLFFVVAAVLLAALSGPFSCSTKPLLASRDTDPYYLEQKVKDRYEVYERLKLEEEAAMATDRADDAAMYRQARGKAYQEYLDAEAEYARVLEEIKRKGLAAQTKRD
ncbi:MAG: hypothetical protein GYA47_06270 [Desulfovibrio sp.]|nr:hypothetical protein [Desulfovibrio sp.]